MHIRSKPKIVILGMLTKMPVAGNIWLVAQYLIGFQRLGYDVYYVEAHGCTPRELMSHAEDDGWLKAAALIDSVMRRFDLGNQWAYHAVHAGDRVYGMTQQELHDLYSSADLIINLHGGTEPLPEHYATGRLAYLGTDPVEVELEIFHNVQTTIDFLAPHSTFFTWGLNYGNPDCKLPYSERFTFHPSAPPVILDFWSHTNNGEAKSFTTIGNWRQPHRLVQFQGEVYQWSKHLEYLKFVELPHRVDQQFELALASYEEADQRMLESHGWQIRPAMSFSTDLDAYRDYIQRSRGEFTVAKDQNIRLRSGWFSERSAQYLAAGRPVITQETGFSNVLPTGRGLFGFSTMADILAAVDSINSDYPGHCRTALEVARDHFNYDVVLPQLLEKVGLTKRCDSVGV